MRLAVLVSGSGTILDAICDAGIAVAVVVLDRPCAAQQVAERHGVPWSSSSAAANGRDFDRDGYTAELVGVLTGWDVDPSPWPASAPSSGTPCSSPSPDASSTPSRPAGRRSPAGTGSRTALAYGVKVTGCTVHVATEEVAPGPILAQEAVTVEPDDTVASLHERIKGSSARIYIRTISEILERGSSSEGPSLRLRQGRRRRVGRRLHELGWDLVSSGGTAG